MTKQSAKAGEAAIVVNGWTIYAHPLLLDQIEKLAAKAATEQDKQGNATKVLAWITRAIFDEVPYGPGNSAYRQGKTLGKGNSHWHRVKYAGRFRLFYRYDSKSKIIIFAWVNDENTLRTYGSKTDAYSVFKDMVADGNPPNTWDALVDAASTQVAMKRLSNLR